MLTKEQNAKVKTAIRRLSMYSPERKTALDKAFVGVKLNEKTGRQAKHFACACCGEEFPSTGVQVDHILPIIPVTGFDSWDETLDRLFNGSQQVLCKQCHKLKSNEENKTRRDNARANV